MPDHTHTHATQPPTAEKSTGDLLQDIADGPLLGFLITAEARRRAAARGITLTWLVRPFPNCPSCGHAVDGASDNMSVVDRVLGPWTMTLNPCGHAFTCTLMKAEQLAEQARRLVDDQEALTPADRKARAAERAADEEAAAAEGCPEPGPDSDSDSGHDQLITARQPAYDAVYAYIRTLPRGAANVERNATIWHAVNHALDAAGVGLCVASHCVEGGHILPADPPTA